MLRRTFSNPPGYSPLPGVSGTKKNIGILSFGCLILIFIILGVVYYSISTYRHSQGFKEFSCVSDDSACIAMICPVGMVWDEDARVCILPDGYLCCPDSASILRCQQGEECSDNVLVSGVLPSAQTFCYPGFVWVPWRKKCFRKI